MERDDDFFFYESDASPSWIAEDREMRRRLREVRKQEKEKEIKEREFRKNLPEELRQRLDAREQQDKEAVKIILDRIQDPPTS
jgi:alpha-galactosidase/6-phospho-beta-glucosidase family protein